MKKLFLFLSLLIINYGLLAAEEITITTYYPSPYGVYNQLQSNSLGVGDNNVSGGLDSGDVPDPATAPGDVWIKGKVGIGTTAPIDKLHVYGGTLRVSNVSDARLALQHDGSANAIVGINGVPPPFSQTGFILASAFGISKHLTGIDDGDSYLVSRGTGKLHFGESSDAPTITIIGAAGTGVGSGNVGIGTTSPGAKLDVKGAGNTSATFGLGVRNSADVYSLAVRDDGNVGIGTANPGAKLHVNGAIKIADEGVQPVCNATTRGTIWFEAGPGGGPDAVEICVQRPGFTYAWRNMIYNP